MTSTKCRLIMINIKFKDVWFAICFLLRNMFECSSIHSVEKKNAPPEIKLTMHLIKPSGPKKKLRMLWN